MLRIQGVTLTPGLVGNLKTQVGHNTQGCKGESNRPPALIPDGQTVNLKVFHIVEPNGQIVVDTGQAVLQRRILSQAIMYTAVQQCPTTSLDNNILLLTFRSCADGSIRMAVAEHLAKDTVCHAQMGIVDLHIHMRGQQNGGIDHPQGLSCPSVDSGDHHMITAVFMGRIHSRLDILAVCFQRKFVGICII